MDSGQDGRDGEREREKDREYARATVGTVNIHGIGQDRRSPENYRIALSFHLCIHLFSKSCIYESIFVRKYEVIDTLCIIHGFPSLIFHSFLSIFLGDKFAYIYVCALYKYKNIYLTYVY